MNFNPILLGLAILLVLVVIGYWLAGSRARAALKAKYPPTGQMIDVGDQNAGQSYRLHIFCQGEGSPAVVMEAGQGCPGLSWAAVQPEVAKFTRACVYDRAGLGWSEASPRPRTAKVMVEELHTLLDRAGVPGPYVLVGHSTGAMNVRLYAHQYPAEVAGIVLVDAAHEEQFSPEPIQKVFNQLRMMMPVMFGVRKFLAASGMMALNPRLVEKSDPVLGSDSNIPKATLEAYRALVSSDGKHMAAVSAELRELPQTHAQMRAARILSLGDLPLVVISHSEPTPMMTPEMTSLFEDTFQRLQDEMAMLSTNSKRVIAEKSGHNIPLDRPDLVIEAIREVVNAVREREQAQKNRGIPQPSPDGYRTTKENLGR